MREKWVITLLSFNNATYKVSFPLDDGQRPQQINSLHQTFWCMILNPRIMSLWAMNYFHKSLTISLMVIYRQLHRNRLIKVSLASERMTKEAWPSLHFLTLPTSPALYHPSTTTHMSWGLRGEDWDWRILQGTGKTLAHNPIWVPTFKVQTHT